MSVSDFKKNMRVTVVDCATIAPAYQCFNRLVNAFGIPMEYHLPPTNGLESLRKSKPADAYILFGSTSDVCDRLDWQKEVALFAREKLNEKIPVLGICFGHQLMADHFGGTVDLVRPDRILLEGTRQFSICDNQWGFKAGETLRIFKCHRYEVKKLPATFQCLGSSSECLYDLVCHRTLPYLGVQGHPEASWDFYETLTPTLSEQEINEAGRDGLSLIRRFLSQV